MVGPAPRVVVVADSESRWRWGAQVARRLVPDHAVDARFLPPAAAPGERALARAGVEPETCAALDYGELIDDPAVHDAGVVILATMAGTVAALLHSLGIAWSGAPRRPITVSGYAGLVDENLVDGLLLRLGSDLVLANSPHDAERFRAIYRSLGADEECVVTAGLPFLDGARHDPRAAGGARPFTVCFAAQRGVPGTRSARAGLLEKLRRHAQLHPDREVVIALGGRPPAEAVAGVSPDRGSYRALFDELTFVPPNLTACHGETSEALDRADLLVTVGSSAAIEAIRRGIPTAILTDYGIREVLGNHYFVHSGCLASFTQLDEGLVPRADPAWVTSRGLGSRDPFVTARARMSRLRVRQGTLPRLRPYYTPQNARDHLEALLSRRGLGLSGRPLPAAAPAHPTAVRRLIAPAARGLYRVGRQRVAPVIRRLAGG